MKLNLAALLSIIVFAATLTGAHFSHAAEGFQLRYGMAGSLGAEMFLPPEQTGPAVGLVETWSDIKKVTGNDGNTLTRIVPGGIVPLPAPTPSSFFPTYGPSIVNIDASGTQAQTNFVLRYITPGFYGGGRVALGFTIPYATKSQSFAAVGLTPSLNWNAAVPGATRAAVGAQFDSGYQSSLASQAASESGRVSNIGDAEFQMGWLYGQGKLRVLASASLVAPTGKYDSAPGPDIGFGNYYTLRPAVQVVYFSTEKIAIAGKLTVGLNSRNKDNDLRSGNWVGLEAAAGYFTSLGPVGVQVIRVQQYQDDSNNPWGANRLRSTSAGVFFITRIPVLEASLTGQFMKTIDSRNAKHGSYTQLRLIKWF